MLYVLRELWVRKGLQVHRDQRTCASMDKSKKTAKKELRRDFVAWSPEAKTLNQKVPIQTFSLVR